MPDFIPPPQFNLNVELPEPAVPAGAYAAAVLNGNLLHVSGQVPSENGELMRGRIGADRDVDYGRRAARSCGLMLLAQIKAKLGSLERVDRIIKLGVFVNSAPDFVDQPLVANGVSELMTEVLGTRGVHARTAVAAPTLPLGVAVEVDAIVAVKR